MNAHTKTLLLLAAGMVAFISPPAYAEYSPWIKIQKIESYGRVLKRKKLIPVKVECKRGPGRRYWRNTLMRLKLATRPPYRITGWQVTIRKVYNSGQGESRSVRSAYHSRVIVPPGKSGISAACGIVYDTPGRKRIFKRRRRLF